MQSSTTKRWVTAPVAAAVLALTWAAAPALADVTVERSMKTGGIAGFGAGESTSVEKLSGLRKRSVTNMKMTGFLGKVAGDLGGDEITDIQKDVVWRIDHKKKTYTESRITPPPKEKGPAEEQGRQEKGEKPNVRVVRNEITVTGPDGKKTIGEWSCDHYQIVWLLEVENLDTKERTESTMTSDLWTTPETAETRALTKEEREFVQAWLKKIGWDVSEQDARKMGMAMVGSLLGGDEESFKKGVRDVAAKMEKIKGYAIGTGVKWQVKSSGGAAEKQGGGGEGTPDVSQGLGGLMSAFGKKVAKSAASGSGKGDAGGARTVFDTYSEIHKISTASVAGDEFVPPAGYKKVE